MSPLPDDPLPRKKTESYCIKTRFAAQGGAGNIFENVFGVVFRSKGREGGRGGFLLATKNATDVGVFFISHKGIM